MKEKNKTRFKRITAAIAATVAITFTPLTENIARAQEPKPEPKVAPAEAPKGEESAPKDDAVPAEDVPDPAHDEAEPEEAKPVPIKLGRRKPAAKKAEPKPKPKPEPKPDAGAAVDAEAGTADTASFETQFDDADELSASPYSDQIDVFGRKRHITLDHPIDVGGNAIVVDNTASAMFGRLSYSLRGKDWPTTFSLDAGNIWFGEHEAPYTRLMARPMWTPWRFKFAYYGSAAFVANMPSWSYNTHSAGMSYSHPFRKDMTLRVGALGGGAASYPAYDDIFFNFHLGSSFEVDKVLTYAKAGFYMVPDNIIETLYIGNYTTPQWNNIELGVQARFNLSPGEEYAGRLFVDYGRIHERIGARISRTFEVSDALSLDFMGGLGVTHWNKDLGGRWDPMFLLTFTGVFGGRYVNSTNSVRIEHLQTGGSRLIYADIPDNREPGPYGFGRSGNAEWDAEVNTAKRRLLAANSFEEFTQMYTSASTNQVINTARFIGAFLQQVAYANDAYSELTSGRVFSSEVRRVSRADEEQIFGYMQRYVDFYENNSTGAELPPDLKRGIAVCAGIHYVMAKFMHDNGVNAIVVPVNTRNGPHVVTIAMPEGSTALLDYGNMYVTPENTFDETIRVYGEIRAAPTFQMPLYHPDRGFMGYYITSEGRLKSYTIGIDNSEELGKLLNVR